MARDFSDPKKLGFMRFIQVVFVLNVTVSIAGLVFLIKGYYDLSFASYLGYANVIFDAVSFWLIWNRMKAARYFTIAFSIFNIAIGAIYNIATVDFNIIDQLFASGFDIVLLVYFLTSRRAKAVLVQPFSIKVERKRLEGEEAYFAPRKWSFWRNLAIYFCVFSVVGHWMEAGYCMLIRIGWLPGVYDPNSQIWQDWLYPFLVYGVGFVACAIIFFPIKKIMQEKINTPLVPLILTFIISAIVCSLIELAMGLVLNQPNPDGSMPLWDYRDLFCNFMGQICLQNSIAFGLAATFVTWVVYPALEHMFGQLSNDVMNIIFIVVVVFFCMLFFLYCINVVIPGSDPADAMTAYLNYMPPGGEVSTADYIGDTAFWRVA